MGAIVNLKQAKDPIKPLDPGLYVVTVLGYDEDSFNFQGKDIPMYKFKLSVSDAKFDGDELPDYVLDYSVSTNLTTNEKNKLFQLLKVLNVNLEVNANFDLDMLIGKKFKVLVSTKTKKRQSDGQEYSFPVVTDVLPYTKKVASKVEHTQPVISEKKSTSMPIPEKNKVEKQNDGPSDEDLDDIIQKSTKDIYDT